MSLSTIVGEIDTSTAAFLSVCAIAASVVTSAIVAKFSGRLKLTQEFELEKMKLENAAAEDQRKGQRVLEIELGKIAVQRDVQLAQGTITGYARTGEEG
jgi:hypothetical protein